MLKNYFLVAIRNFWRHKVSSLINIAGLSIGISASLIIFLLVHYDLSFDKFEKGRDRIYRVVTDFTFAGEPNHNSGVCYPLHDAVATGIPGLETIAPLNSAEDNLGKVTVPNGNQPTIFKKQTGIVYADRNLLDLIGYTWLQGSPATALNQPYQLVLTESNARLYFPHLALNEIIGRNLIFADTISTTITGIVKDISQNTDFTFKTFVSYSTLATARLRPFMWDKWGSTNGVSQLFVKLTPTTTPASLTARLKALFLKHNPPKTEDHYTTDFKLQPLADMHFNADYGVYDDNRTAHKPTLYALLAVAAFLLLLACINFVNLTTAQATQRAKEIGIRKTMGSQRRQLALQFLNETFLLTAMATILSIAITPLLLNVFADFIPAGLKFNLFDQPIIFLFVILLIAAATLFSGFYPAIVMSAYKPIAVLKNQVSATSARTRSAWFRKSLTISQFVIAQVFIIGTILVGKQISYVLNKDLGFKKDAIVYFGAPWHGTKENRALLWQQLHTIPGIALLSQSATPPSLNSTWSTTMKYIDGKKEVVTEVQYKLADTNYLGLYNLRLLAGTNITQSDTSNALIINETWLHTLGFRHPADAIGKSITWNKKTVPIVGVVADFHQRSLHEAIKPLAITNGTKYALNFNVALNPKTPDTWQKTLAQIKNTYTAIYPDDEFSYEFVDETVAKFYTAEKNIEKLLTWATGLAIFISCLGLLGLVIFITNQRTKEIGIRKVIGATVTQIVFLLSKDFIKLVGLAILIALPFSWWGSHKWLESFAYRTDLSWWVFAAGGVILLVIALMILCLRTLLAARANPVESLRSE